MKESKFVKTKIFAGYAILIAVCVLSVGYVYRTVVRFSTPDGSYSLLPTKRSVAGQALYALYQAVSYGQLRIAGVKSYESRYNRVLRTVRGLIDSLRGLTAAVDSLQTMRLDSFVRLLADKERRTMSLRRTIRSAATSSLLDKNIRELIGPADSAAHGDSVVVRAADTVASRVVVQATVNIATALPVFVKRISGSRAKLPNNCTEFIPLRLRLFVNLDDQVLQDVVLDLHNTVDFFDNFRISFKVNQYVVTVSLLFDSVCQVAFAPTINLFDIAAILLDQIGNKFSNRIYFSVFQRLCDKHDFVLIHEITSSSGLWPFISKGQG